MKVGVFDVDLRVLSHLKKELARAVDKQLWVISTTLFFISWISLGFLSMKIYMHALHGEYWQHLVYRY